MSKGSPLYGLPRVPDDPDQPDLIPDPSSDLIVRLGGSTLSYRINELVSQCQHCRLEGPMSSTCSMLLGMMGVIIPTSLVGSDLPSEPGLVSAVHFAL